MFNVTYGNPQKDVVRTINDILTEVQSIFSSLFQQPVKIIVLAASKNLECSLEEKDYYFFFFQTLYDYKCLEITSANNFYYSCILPT